MLAFMSEQSLGPPDERDIDVSIDADVHVAIVEIRRGPDNFFSLDLLVRLADALDELGAGSTRAIVLCSEGKNFCAGADFSGAAGAMAQDGRPHLYDVATRLFEQPLPIVAAVQGAAIGGGLGLAMAADFRVAAPSSRFAANFALLGFHHGFGLSATLPAAVGQGPALELLYTGRRVDGEKARSIGLCDRLVPEADLRSSAVDLASEIALSAPLAVRSIRATMRGRLVADARAAMERERAEQERLVATSDFVEGVAAVRQRRPAAFAGR